jgi:hypothetical protein
MTFSPMTPGVTLKPSACSSSWSSSWMRCT